MSSPTARSLGLLRRDGWTAEVVERWNYHAGVRQDLFTIIDLIAMRAGEPLLAVQATTASNLSARLRKCLACHHLKTWLETGSRFEVWAWSKRGPRGGRKLWQVTRRILSLAELGSSSTQ